MATSPRARVIRTSNKSKASIWVQDNSVAIMGNDKNFMVCDERGITFKGPVSFVTDATGRRNGALFVGVNDFLEIIPQTMVTPFPSKMPFPPVQMVGSIVKDVAFFASLLV